MAEWVLAFDTATDRCALALGSRDATGRSLIHEADFDAPRAALGRLLPAVDSLLAEAGITPGELTAIVVGRGPGSFTGVRIGVATAKGLAHALGIPLYGAGTLDAIAWGCAAHAEGLLGVVGDAMRGEVYPALFRLAAGRVTRLGDDRVMHPDALVEEWATLAEPLTSTGWGLHRYAEALAPGLGMDRGGLVLPVELWSPTGAGLLAAHAAATGAGCVGDGDPATLLPVYTRLSDAEEAERLRGVHR